MIGAGICANIRVDWNEVYAVIYRSHVYGYACACAADPNLDDRCHESLSYGVWVEQRETHRSQPLTGSLRSTHPRATGRRVLQHVIRISETIGLVSV